MKRNIATIQCGNWENDILYELYDVAVNLALDVFVLTKMTVEIQSINDTHMLSWLIRQWIEKRHIDDQFNEHISKILVRCQCSVLSYTLAEELIDKVSLT